MTTFYSPDYLLICAVYVFGVRIWRRFPMKERRSSILTIKWIWLLTRYKERIELPISLSTEFIWFSKVKFEAICTPRYQQAWVGLITSILKENSGSAFVWFLKNNNSILQAFSVRWFSVRYLSVSFRFFCQFFMEYFDYHQICKKITSVICKLNIVIFTLKIYYAIFYATETTFLLAQLEGSPSFIQFHPMIN